MTTETTTTKDGIEQTIEKSIVADQSFYFVLAVEAANYADNRHFGGAYDLTSAKAMLKRLTAAARRQRTINARSTS